MSMSVYIGLNALSSLPLSLRGPGLILKKCCNGCGMPGTSISTGRPLHTIRRFRSGRISGTALDRNPRSTGILTPYENIDHGRDRGGFRRFPERGSRTDAALHRIKDPDGAARNLQDCLPAQIHCPIEWYIQRCGSSVQPRCGERRASLPGTVGRYKTEDTKKNDGHYPQSAPRLQGEDQRPAAAKKQGYPEYCTEDEHPRQHVRNEPDYGQRDPHHHVRIGVLVERLRFFCVRTCPPARHGTGSGLDGNEGSLVPPFSFCSQKTGPGNPSPAQGSYHRFPYHPLRPIVCQHFSRC